MAGPLGTTVFQVPKLGETGFRIDQVNEQKRKQAQQQLEKEVAATGAEKAYMENAMGLTGIYKQVADAGFQAFQQAAVEYEKTGSSTAEARMKQAAAELSYAVNAGTSILGTAGDEYVKNKANGFKDVALSPEEASELYTGFVNRTGEVIVKNGRVMVKDGDSFVPAVESTYLQSSVNLNNSMILPRVIKQGTYVDPEAFIKDVSGAISAGSSPANAQSRVNTLFDEKMKDPNFQADILTAYAISKDDGLGMVDDPSKLSADKYNEIQQMASNEEIVMQAENWYRERVLNSVPPRWKATGSGGGLGISIGGGTSKDLMFIENETIATSPMKKEGDKYVIDTEAKTVDVNFDTYTRFQSNLQGKSYTDAKQFQYDIVGIGVKDGKLYADKESSEQERGFFASDGREYKRKAEPMTLSELSGLPTETRELIFGYLGGREKVESMVRGESKAFDPNKY